jgi:hypothetical protein
MATFDAATAIAQFLEDGHCTFLQLPHMTTGQRKVTKKLLENYPELRCESFGFGQERQLHVFKKNAGEPLKPCAPGAVDINDGSIPLPVNIKNTFINDWISAEPEPIQFRSLQHNSDGKSIDIASLARMSPQEDASRSASTTPLPADRTIGNVDSIQQDTPSLATHEDVQVRNTFIHFEGVPKDERVVQSMPRGMFKRCILAEESEGQFNSDTPTTAGCDTPTSASEADLELLACPLGDAQGRHVSPGTLVVLEGLIKLPAFNGRSAVVQGWDEESQRYDILIGSADCCQQAKIKVENLRVVAPCP